MVDTAKGFAGLFGVGMLRSPREVSSSWSWLTLQFPERGFGNWRLHCDRGHRSDRPDLQLVVHVCTKGSDCTSGHSHDDRQRQGQTGRDDRGRRVPHRL